MKVSTVWVGAVSVFALHCATTPPSKTASDESKAKTTAPTASPSIKSEGVNVGDAAPAFSLASQNNTGAVTLGKGKVTIVDFWATWCAPCATSFPKLQSIHQRYQASGVNVVGISIDDDKAKIPAFLSQNRTKFAVGWDADHTVAAAYKPPTMPSSFVIDKKGKVRFRHVGWEAGEEEKLESELKQLLAEK